MGRLVSFDLVNEAIMSGLNLEGQCKKSPDTSRTQKFPYSSIEAIKTAALGF